MGNSSKMKCLDNGNKLREDKANAVFEVEKKDPQIYGIKKRTSDMIATLSKKDFRDASAEFFKNLYQPVEIALKNKADKHHNKKCDAEGRPKLRSCGD